MTRPVALHKCEIRPGAEPQQISDAEAACGQLRLRDRVQTG